MTTDNKLTNALNEQWAIDTRNALWGALDTARTLTTTHKANPIGALRDLVDDIAYCIPHIANRAWRDYYTDAVEAAGEEFNFTPNAKRGAINTVRHYWEQLMPWDINGDDYRDYWQDQIECLTPEELNPLNWRVRAEYLIERFDNPHGFATHDLRMAIAV